MKQGLLLSEAENENCKMEKKLLQARWVRVTAWLWLAALL